MGLWIIIALTVQQGLRSFFFFFQTRFVLDTAGQNNYQRKSISEDDAVPPKEIFRQCRLFCSAIKC